MVMQDPRRRPDEDQAFGGGIGGPNITPGMMMPFFQGSPNYDFSGIQGRGGLQAYLQAMAQNPGRGPGPAGRHLRNVGQPVDFPGTDDQMGIGAPGPAIGGPNVAPGSPNGLAIGQSGALPPGLERQQQGMINSQGWRNLHPGYSAAASVGFGSQEQGAGFLSGQGGRGAPGATADAPGPGGKNHGPGPGAGGEGPVKQAANAPATHSFGGPAQNTGGPPGAGTGGAPGGGNTRSKGPSAGGAGTLQGGSQNTGGVGGKDLSQSEREHGAQRGRAPGSAAGPGSAGTSASTARNRTAASSGGGAPVAGNAGTGADTAKRRSGPLPTASTPPPASSFGKDTRGSGTAPIGKKKSSGYGNKPKPTVGGLAARRA